VTRRRRNRAFRVVASCPRCGAAVFAGTLYDGQSVLCDVDPVADTFGRRLVAYVLNGVTRVRPCDPSIDFDCSWFTRHECGRRQAV